MTGIDSETSQDIAEAISLKGGRYLEAQIQGSKTQAQDGTLVILVSGDRSLFDDCQSCFQAMGKNSFYLGEVGNATKMNLVLQVNRDCTNLQTFLCESLEEAKKFSVSLLERTIPWQSNHLTGTSGANNPLVVPEVPWKL